MCRYLAGGRAPHVKHEQLFRFEFPERPGALHSFLTELSQGWNVSLFHYRNQGGDMGRVLVGLQVSPQLLVDVGSLRAFTSMAEDRRWDCMVGGQVEPKDEEAFKAFLKNLRANGYLFYNETNNSIYHKFLYGGKR